MRGRAPLHRGVRADHGPRLRAEHRGAAGTHSPQPGDRLTGSRASFFTVAGGLLALYGWVAFGLPGDADVLAHSSGLYDMDVARVVVDLTSGGPGHRASAHPLQKILIAPVGGLLKTSAGGDGLAAARVLTLVATWLGALAAGALAAGLTRAWLPATLALALTGSSFAFLLAAGVPESATFSGLLTAAPLLLLLARTARPLGWGETLGWGALACLAFGLTVTQVANVGIAFAVRLVGLRRGADPTALAGRAMASLAAAALLFVALTEVQVRLYPETPRFWDQDPIRAESAFTRPTALRGMPLRHTARLAAHFAVIDFAAPWPALSDFLIRDYGIDTWSLSAEEAGATEWRPAQRILAAGLLAALVASLALGRWRDPALLAPAACPAFHFALHLVYGREYVIYAPHWHGVLVAVVVAIAWNGGRGRRGLPVAASLLAGALLANNLVVLRAAYAEVRVGLGVESRDDRGAALERDR